MIVEGKGLCAPSPWRRKLERSELLLAVDSATRIAEFRSYRSSRRRWKRGLTGSLSISGIADNIRSDVAPFVLGVIGEMAVAICFDVAIDDRLLPGGDSGADFQLGKARVQVKTRSATSSHASGKVNLVRAADERGFNKLPRVAGFVFCEFDCATLWVAILGWCRMSSIAGLPLVKARKGDHLNIEIPDSHLEPVGSLRALLNDAY